MTLNFTELFKNFSPLLALIIFLITFFIQKKLEGYTGRIEKRIEQIVDGGEWPE
jgi:hypothetical protein